MDPDDGVDREPEECSTRPPSPEGTSEIVPLDEHPRVHPPPAADARIAPRPRQRRRQHEQQRAAQPDWRAADLICRVWEGSFQRSVADLASKLGLTAAGEDVAQELLMWLAHYPDKLDLNNEGWRSWLLKKAEYMIEDLRRSDTRLGRPTSPKEFDADGLAGTAKSSEEIFLDSTEPGTFGWHHEREEVRDTLRRVGLSETQFKVIDLILESGFDMSLQDIARLLGRPYPAVRQDKSRGTRKISKTLIGLSRQEHAVFSCWWKNNSIDAMMEKLGLEKEEILQLLATARTKVSNFLTLRQGRES